MRRIIDWISRLPDPVRRALRTWLQGFVGALIVLLPSDVVFDAAVYIEALAAAAYAGVVALVTWAHNALEDRGSVPELAKRDPWYRD